jgi:hypothetical protein
VEDFSERQITERDIEQIKKAMRIVESGVSSVNNWADNILRDHFSQTHPNTSFKWGLRSHHDSSNELISPYSKYLSCCIVQYLINDHHLYSLVDYGESTGEPIIEENYKVNIDPLGTNTSGGQYMLDSNEVWVSFIPKKWEQKIQQKLQSELEQTWLKSFLVKFPVYFNSLSPTENYTSKYFLGTLSHEYTHYYVSNNTKIRSEILKAINTDQQEQIMNVANNAEIRAIDEIFGHYIGVVIKGETKAEGTVEKGYKKGEYISWGRKFLSSYLKNKKNQLDTARKMEVDIFQKIARKGQIKENSKRRTPLIFFLEECLNQQNKEIISELRKIEKKELKGVIGDIEKLQVQFDNSQIKTDIQKAVSDLENICSIEDNILEYLLEQCYSKNQYNEYANRELQNIIRSEYEDLEASIEDIEQLITQTENPKAENKLKKLLSELKTIEKDLKKII